jgi:protein O-GlcNAc transferase
MDGQFERSVEDLRVAAALNSKNYQAILELGVNFDVAARDHQAQRLFEMAAKVAPDIALPQYIYGQFLINRRYFELGLTYIARAIKLDPLRAERYVSRGFGLLGPGTNRGGCRFLPTGGRARSTKRCNSRDLAICTSAQAMGYQG